MDIESLFKLAVERKRSPENVIARGAIIEFLIYDTQEKFLPSEIGKFFNCTKQNVYYSLRNINEKYRDYALLHKCKDVIERNKEYVRNSITT